MDKEYRADIDGLRAVAVLAVVGFHAFPGWFKGGFVGVDVFFVISGYLISKIILGGLDRNRFSFVEFYSRRVRRIFPALAIMLTFCLVAGWFVLLPNEYTQLGKHVAAGAGFVSNLVLWSESGYFDATASTKLLLHLWSLGIEEQFYFVWPVLLFVVRRRGLGALLTLVFVASFALNMYLLDAHPVATFYNPLTRFWELLVGAGLAHVTLHRPAWLMAERPRLRSVMACVGGALILTAIRFFHSEQPFPGWRALLPTTGACLLIWAGPRALPNRVLLASRPMVWVGLISYPLYLWHWPLLTFARVVAAQTPSPRVRIVAVLCSFVLAWLTYRYVERLVRVEPQKKSAVPVLVASVAGLFAFGMFVLEHGGFLEERGPWNVLEATQSYGKQDQFSEDCIAAESHLFLPKFDRDRDFCHLTRGAEPKPEIVVIGDSHAGRIYSGLQVAAVNHTILDLGRGSCLPLVGYDVTNPGSPEPLDCSPTMERIVDRAIAASPRVVVLGGFFALPYDGRTTLRNKVPVQDLMRTTLVRLANAVAKVVVVLDVPELPFDPGYCVERPFRRGSGERGRCGFSRHDADQQLALYEPDLRRAAAGLANVSFFDPSSVLCDADTCFAVEDRNLLYDDRNHLSRYAAGRMGAALMATLE